ncbi:MAG: cytochrome c [Acidobacteria bacterium]|nr:cytochrome c [Acidobacteriota bacterium]
MGRRLRGILFALPGALLAAAGALALPPPQAGPVRPPAIPLETGEQIWKAGCVACHGADGGGQPQNVAGFEPPATFPDFADCATSTVESDLQWRAIITNGGPARGFSRIMPAFRDLLTPRQIDLVIAHMRTMCRETAWPRGDLNLPRPMITEKAFPESETVVSGAINAQGDAGVGSTVIYERRIGAKAMWEAFVPYAFARTGGIWRAAFGDLGLGYKRALFHRTETGTIVSAGAELVAPTGSRAAGTGGASTVFEGYGAYGQILPASSFVQLHGGIELPAHPDKVPRAFYLRAAIGRTFAGGGGLGRRWTPMIEIVGDRELERGAVMECDVVPQLQIPLNRRMHILGSIALKVPAVQAAGRARQAMFYLLWDWMDGGLAAGW